MHVETETAAQWWAKPRTDTWVAGYQKSTGAKHRSVIASIVKALQPADLLEVGCHCGPNLMRLADELPALEMVGIDVNKQAIEAGRRWVESKGLTHRIQLQVGCVPDATSRLTDGVADVVLSCYALAYIAPSDIDAVLYEIGRLAAKAVILAEPMGRDPKWSESGYSEWAHAYQDRAKWIGTLRDMTWRTALVSPPVDALSAVLVGVRNEVTP